MSVVKALPKVAGQYVDTNHVDLLLSNYKKERWINNSKKLGKPDSLSVWYGMDQLQDFLQTASEYGADGVRMYFGVYPEQFDKVPQFAGRQTLVMVATKNKADEQGNVISKHIYRQTEEGMQLLAFNLGSMCPPFCTSTGMGDDDGIPYFIQKGVGLTIVDDKEKGMYVM